MLKKDKLIDNNSMGRRFEFLGYSGMTAAKKELAKGDLDKMIFRPTDDFIIEVKEDASVNEMKAIELVAYKHGGWEIKEKKT